MINTIPIPALKDNYIWCLVNTENNHCLIVDPGEAQPVIETIKKHKLTISAILITHHHWDHSNGLAELCELYSVPVYGHDQSPLPSISKRISEQPSRKTISIHQLCEFEVIDIPGHTLDHVAYYINNYYLFCGDTLFTAGCGRIFEGTAEQLFHSLEKLKALPNSTQIYCGHEYTIANLKFAKTVEPENVHILDRLKEAEKLRSNHLPTLPSTIELEKLTNPFLRIEQADVIESVNRYAQKKLTKPVEVFKYLRLWKDQI